MERDDRTFCNQPGQRTPLWQVKAERIVYDQQKHRIHFRDAVMEIYGVPVLYTPFLSQPDPTVKYASGFLAPDLGNSTKIGYFVRLPVYFALSPTNDLTVAPQISTLGGDVMEAEYRARWNNGGLWLQGSGAYNPNGGLSGGGPGAQTYGHLFGSGRIGLDGDWRTGFDVQTTTNNAYMRYYDISYLDRLVNDLFVENGRFALNTLTSHHKPLSIAFSGLTGLPAEKRFELGEWDKISTGAPTLADALVVFDCELIDTKDLATHRVLFGKVTGLRTGDNLKPLIYHGRDYHVL